MAASHRPTTGEIKFFESKKTSGGLLTRSKYINPWPNFHLPSASDKLKIGKDYVFGISKASMPSDSKELESNLPVQRMTESIKQEETDGIRVTWLGHASLIVQMNSLTILTDPVFSKRCSLTQMAGPCRYRPVPAMHKRQRNITGHTGTIVKGLGLDHVDVVVISHNHFDHLDTGSVEALGEEFKDAQWLVPAGVDDYMRKTLPKDYNANNITALEWWRKTTINGLDFTFVPAKHWSGRGAFDRYDTLWGGWCFGSENTKRFYFTGDTGYCDELFKYIGEKFDGFDCAAIPIGAYCPRSIMAPQHVDPEEAVKIHVDIRAKQSVGIHWGTFALAYEPYMEPPKKLVEHLDNKDIPHTEFVAMDHGETMTFPMTDEAWEKRDDRRKGIGKPAVFRQKRVIPHTMCAPVLANPETKSETDLAEERNEFISHESGDIRETNLDETMKEHSIGMGIDRSKLHDELQEEEGIRCEEDMAINLGSRIRESSHLLQTDPGNLGIERGQSSDTTMNTGYTVTSQSHESTEHHSNAATNQTVNSTMTAGDTAFSQSKNPGYAASSQSDVATNPGNSSNLLDDSVIPPCIGASDQSGDTTMNPTNRLPPDPQSWCEIVENNENTNDYQFDSDNMQNFVDSKTCTDKTPYLVADSGKGGLESTPLQLDESNTQVTVDETKSSEAAGNVHDHVSQDDLSNDWSILQASEMDQE